MSNTPRPTRNEQREAARQKAREMREAQKRSASRKRVTIIASVIALVAGIGVAVAFSVTQEVNNPVPTAATPANMIFDGGIKLGIGMKPITDTATQAGTPNIIVYEDLQCPNCRNFEIPNSAQLRDWVNSGTYTLEVHPISFLDGRSTPNQYSSRAGSALLCVANGAPEKFFDYNSALYNNQPEEGTVGPSNDSLASLAQTVGVNNKPVLDCIKNSTYQSYILDYTNNTVFKKPVAGTNLNVDGTPYIVLNGQHFNGDFTNAAVFAQWVKTTAPTK
jgi:protein-disulfide isomerase